VTVADGMSQNAKKTPPRSKKSLKVAKVSRV